jgi:hypothetical protein
MASASLPKSATYIKRNNLINAVPIKTICKNWMPYPKEQGNGQQNMQDIYVTAKLVQGE